MDRTPLGTPLAAAILLLTGPALSLLACGEDEPATPCVTHEDCAAAEEKDAIEDCGGEPTTDEPARSARVAAYCVQGTCKAECAAACGPLDKSCDRNVNPGSVCNLPAGLGSSSPGVCVKTPIPCTTRGDGAAFNGCPEERPGQGEWTCENGVCRFPGFSYAFE